MSFFRRKKVKSEEQKIQLTTIDLNAPDCIFDLPQIAAEMEAEDGVIRVVEIMSEEAEKLMEEAREGQGFGTIEKIYKDLSEDQWVKEARGIPAFNKGDSLLREDKNGNPFLLIAESTAKMGQSGSGVIHTQARNISQIFSAIEKIKDPILQEEVRNLTFTVKTLEMPSRIAQLRNFIGLKGQKERGYILGGSWVKGAESHLEKDYTIQILSDEEDISNMRKSFLYSPVKDKKYWDDDDDDEELDVGIPHPRLIEKYQIDLANPQDKHLFLIPTDDQKYYEVYYIRKGTFIRSATKVGMSEIPKDEIDKFLMKGIDVASASVEDKKDISSARQHIVEECLKALTLDKPTINNKSHSQNPHTVIYNPDFKSFIMYLNPERYLLDENKQIMPEGKEWGSYFDLQRSIPMILTDALRKKFIDHFNIKDEKIIEGIIKQQQAKCSSWDNNKHPYNQVIKDFLNASKEEKLQRYHENIHILLRLYEKTLKMCREGKPIWGSKWTKQNSDDYLNNLENRLNQLLISHHKLSKELDLNAEFKSDLFAEDQRSLNDMIKSLQREEKLFSSQDEKIESKEARPRKKTKLEPPENLAERIKKINKLCHASLEELQAPHLLKMKNEVKSLCENKNERSCLDTFNILLNQAPFVCSNKKESNELLRKLFIETKVNSSSALENLIRNKAYRPAVMVLFYGGINSAILEKVSDILIDHIKQEAMIKSEPSSININHLILDDFLRSFVRQTHRHGLTLAPELIKLILDNKTFLPKATGTIEKLTADLIIAEKGGEVPPQDLQQPQHPKA